MVSLLPVHFIHEFFNYMHKFLCTWCVRKCIQEVAHNQYNSAIKRIMQVESITKIVLQCYKDTCSSILKAFVSFPHFLHPPPPSKRKKERKAQMVGMIENLMSTMYGSSTVQYFQTKLNWKWYIIFSSQEGLDYSTPIFVRL